MDSAIPKSISDLLVELSKMSTWHADRARRLLDAGCPKETMREICAKENYFAREEMLDEQEKKNQLFPMVASGLFNPPAVRQEQHDLMMKDYKAMEYEVAHQARVIARMKEREEWFQSRIEQLESFGTTVASALAEMKKKHPEPLPVEEESGLTPLKLSLGDTSLPDHERVASNIRQAVLDEHDMVGGMTPTVPLLPIPTHSLKKQVSWHNISEKEALCDICAPETNCNGNHNNPSDQLEPDCLVCHPDFGCDGDHSAEMRDGMFIRKGYSFVGGSAAMTHRPSK